MPPTIPITSERVEDYYDVLEQIGEGEFGVVYRVREKSTGAIYAAKWVDIRTQTDRLLVLNEVNTWSSLQHPHLLHLHQAFEGADNIAFVFELYSFEF